MSAPRPLRVLFLTESFHPVLGGGETHIRDLGRRLVASGWQATVLTRRGDAAWPREESLDDIRVRRVPPTGPGRVGKYLMAPGALAVLLREGRRFDLLVVRGTRVLGLPGLLAGRVLGKPVIMQAEVNGEMSGEIYTWGTPLDRPLSRRVVGTLTKARNVFMRDADAFVAMSRRIAAELSQAGVPKEKVRFIPHGVDTRRFRPATVEEKAGRRRDLGLPASAVIVVYTGRLLRGKGLTTLLQAFATQASRNPSLHLLLVGSGEGQSLSVEDELRLRTRQQGLDSRVTFTGRVADVTPYLGASDVFALPSVFEALGLSLVEAAACGLPCLGSRTGGIVDVIEDGVSGFLLDPGNQGELAEKLAVLTADPGRRQSMGRSGRSLVEQRFDVEDGMTRYRALFAEVARGPSSAFGRLDP